MDDIPHCSTVYVDQQAMKVRNLKSPKVFPKKVFASSNTSSPRRSQPSLYGQFVLGLLFSVWSGINKVLATTDTPKPWIERAYQDWILPQIKIKSILFISLSVLCVSAGLTVFSHEDYQFFDTTTKWSFNLSLAIMPYVFSSCIFILVIIYFFPSLIEKKQHYVITFLCVTGMLLVPAGGILLNLSEYGSARMDMLLLNAHLLLLTFLYYNQGFSKIIIISIITYISINLINIFTTLWLKYTTEHAIRQVSQYPQLLYLYCQLHIRSIFYVYTCFIEIFPLA